MGRFLLRIHAGLESCNDLVHDMQAALNAAAAFGDDYRRGNQSSRVMPESFTHGTSEQRVRWFKHGFEHARIEQCDTFSADPL